MNATRIVLSSAPSDPLDPDLLIPIVVPAITFAATVAILALVLYFRFRSQRLRQELFVAFLQKGEPIPPSFLAPVAVSRNRDLRRGLVLVTGGLGLAGSLFLARLHDAAGFGLIPILVGAAYLVVWKVERAMPETGASER